MIEARQILINNKFFIQCDGHSAVNTLKKSRKIGKIVNHPFPKEQTPLRKTCFYKVISHSYNISCSNYFFY